MIVNNCTNPIKGHIDNFVKVIFICPICKKKKEVVVPKNAINQTKGLSTLSVHKGLVCEHTFQAYIDKNYKIRGYQKVDFELKSRNNIEKYEPQNLNENEKLLKIKPKSLKEIYEDFKDFIDEENEEFQVFIQNDDKRNHILNANY